MHDTAIAARGLAASGHDAAAGATLRSLLESAMHVDFRMPELYGSDPALATPAPYPASCRPQAWSAASALAMVATVLGLEPDLPAGTLRLRPLRPSPVGPLRVGGIRLGEGWLSVAVDADGEVTEVEAPPGIRVEVAPR